MFFTRRNIIILAVIAVLVSGIYLSEQLITGAINQMQLYEYLDQSPTGFAIATGIPKVVGVHDSDATSWDDVTNYHWDYVSQSVVNTMVSRGVRELTGKASDAEAWSSIINYQSGQYVAIKINMNNFNGRDDWYSVSTRIQPPYQTIKAVVDGLASIGIPRDHIIIYDVTRAIHNKYRDTISGVIFIDSGSGSYRFSDVHPQFTHDSLTGVNIVLALPLVNASHVIDIAQMKAHDSFCNYGVTLTFKNHLGSVNCPSCLHPAGICGNYTTDQNALVDLYKNSNIKDKTRLLIIDGLYGTIVDQYQLPQKYSTFNYDYPNSLWFSFDPVAIDSVVFDYIALEKGVVPHHKYLDDAEAEGLGVQDHSSTHQYTKIQYVAIDLDATECTGNINLGLSPNPVNRGSTVTASAGGLSGCSGKTIYIRTGGTTLCSCTSGSTGCQCTFTASVTGSYDCYSIIDKNGDIDYSDAGEQSTSLTLTVVEPTECTPGNNIIKHTNYPSGSCTDSSTYLWSHSTCGSTGVCDQGTCKAVDADLTSYNLPSGKIARSDTISIPYTIKNMGEIQWCFLTTAGVTDGSNIVWLDDKFNTVAETPVSDSLSRLISCSDPLKTWSGRLYVWTDTSANGGWQVWESPSFSFTVVECLNNADCSACGKTGYICDTGSNTCKPAAETCSDGTAYGSCSVTKPLYCYDGNLINKCTVCGCPTGQNCNTTSQACYTPVTTGCQSGETRIDDSCPSGYVCCCAEAAPSEVKFLRFSFQNWMWSAEKFAATVDVYQAHFNALDKAVAIKAIRSDVLTFVYFNSIHLWTSIYPPEYNNTREQEFLSKGWVLKDIYGNYVMTTYNGTHSDAYYIDFGNSDYHEWLAKWYKYYVDKYSLTGVFVDNWMVDNNVWWYTTNGSIAINPRTGNVWTEQEISDAFKAMTLKIESVIGSDKLIVVNGIANGNHFYNPSYGLETQGLYENAIFNSGIDGIMAENWLCGTDASKMYEYPESTVFQLWYWSIQLADWLEENFTAHGGKIFFIEHGDWSVFEYAGSWDYPDDMTQAQYEQFVIFAWASRLLTVKHLTTMWSLGWYVESPFIQSLFNIDIGTPIEDYHKFGNVYVREFSKGMVLVNPKKSSQIVTIGDGYKNAVYGSDMPPTVTMQPHTGEILLKQ